MHLHKIYDGKNNTKYKFKLFKMLEILIFHNSTMHVRIVSEEY